MINSARTFLALPCLLGLILSTRTAAADPFEWKTATPESQGMSSEKLAALRADMIARGTRAWIVIRHDKIVDEWYAEGVAPDAKQGTASMAKALVGGLSFAVAMTDGLVQPDDPVSKFVPQWASDPRKSRITFRQLGAHASGLGDAEENMLPHDKLPGWKGDFWKRKQPPDDPFTLARDKDPLVAEPGTEIRYSNPGIAMLTYGVTAAIRNGPQKDCRTLLRDRVMRPIGIADGDWTAGYNQLIEVDGLPHTAAWGGASFIPRATARLGRLVLKKGDWDGQRILSPESVAAVTGDCGFPGHAGMGWWTNASGRYDGVPKDAVWGSGAADQLVFVAPSLDLILVRNGSTLGWDLKEGDVLQRFHDGRAKGLYAPLCAAVTDRAVDATSATGARD